MGLTKVLNQGKLNEFQCFLTKPAPGFLYDDVKYSFALSDGRSFLYVWVYGKDIPKLY
jgi:hypothetical protein